MRFPAVLRRASHTRALRRILTEELRQEIRNFRPFVTSLRDYRRVQAMMRGDGPDAGVAVVHVRPLGSLDINLRSGTSDAGVLFDTFFGRYHLPPTELPGSGIREILDLGSNIGLTMAHYATLFPAARIVGVELDAAAARIASAHTEQWADRCTVLHGAAWVCDGTVRYVIQAGQEWGAHVLTGAGEGTEVPALSLNTLVGTRHIDFLKMDVEGAEADLLTKNVQWAAQVATIKVEVHAPFTMQACEEALRTLGFETYRDPRHWSCVVGVRHPIRLGGPRTAPKHHRA